MAAGSERSAAARLLLLGWAQRGVMFELTPVGNVRVHRPGRLSSDERRVLRRLFREVRDLLREECARPC